MLIFVRYVVRGLLLVTIACASGGSSGVQQAAKTNPNLITTEEVRGSSATNAYELIQRLRPSFLRTRGAMRGASNGTTTTFEPVDVVVYLNDSRLGNSEQLRQIPLSDIHEIRYFSASDATTKWGTGHSAGAIQVITN